MRRPPTGFGGGGPPPRDILILLGILFFTFSLSAFRSTAGWVELLQLSRGIWQAGFLWQVVTYPFAANFGGGFFFLLALLITWWFGRDVFNAIGRRAFWRLLLSATVAGGLAAVAMQLLLDLLGASGAPRPFLIMQGEQMMMSVLIAAFATLYGNATIMLFFVLPIQARYFIALEILFAFIAFLGSHDFAGFVGITTAVGVTYFLLRGGDPRKVIRELRLRMERKLLEARLKRMRKKSGLRVVKDDDDDKGVHRGPWVN